MDQTPGVTDAKKQERVDTTAERPLVGKSASIEPNKDSATCKKHTVSSSKQKLQKSTAGKHAQRSESDSDSSSDSSSSSSDSSSSSSSSDSDSSIDPAVLKKKLKAAKKSKAELKAKAKQLKKESKVRKKKLAALEHEASDDSTDDSDDRVRAKVKAARARARKKALRRVHLDNDDDDSSSSIQYEEDPNSVRFRNMKSHLQDLNFAPGFRQPGYAPSRGILPPPINIDHIHPPSRRRLEPVERPLLSDVKPPKVKPGKRASKVAYKRVDQLWDQSIHNFKLTETVKSQDEAVWDQYIFTVRRRFDWEQKYQCTIVDIKSAPLKESLRHIMAGVKGVSLVGETVHMDPNMLFLYLEEMRAYVDSLNNDSTGWKRKEKKEMTTKAKHLKVMVRWLDKDFAETKKTLYPMLENNQITYDLLWALFKPNEIAYTSTYGDNEEGRAFRMDFSTKESSFMRGSWYNIEGKYLEYDGKVFGLGTIHAEVASFQGVRKISSLECYPLQYHKNPDKLREALIERGKKFVQLQGMSYKYHKGMAYTKRKKQVLKINIDGRVMVDPAIHRRINPNYSVSNVKPKDGEPGEEEAEEDCGCGAESSSDNGGHAQNTPSEDTVQEKKRYRAVKLSNGQTAIVLVTSKDEVDQDGNPLADQRQDSHHFTEEELLIASPVVLGFAFGEKLWLEFTVSGISDVVFNDQAFDSLVLPDSQKSIVKALVSSHTFHAHRNIDDIISGKGRGLVAVLHGPPGTGKTLTAEGIADLLKCPLYMVSAGDLGTDPSKLEKELQNILDIAHSWGAILLLDEADVFLEQRSIHDIHRNALVSIFLRLLEYFQGILFLTTNRVETFDSAFVSRIHLSLRFQNLTTKAKRTVWKLFIDRVKEQEGATISTITETDLNDLSRREVNGRQIKNLVRAAHALAIHEEKSLSMAHIRRVIDVAESFEMDLKGGTGYSDAMRSE